MKNTREYPLRGDIGGSTDETYWGIYLPVKTLGGSVDTLMETLGGSIKSYWGLHLISRDTRGLSWPPHGDAEGWLG